MHIEVNIRGFFFSHVQFFSTFSTPISLLFVVVFLDCLLPPVLSVKGRYDISHADSYLKIFFLLLLSSSLKYYFQLFFFLFVSSGKTLVSWTTQFKTYSSLGPFHRWWNWYPGNLTDCRPRTSWPSPHFLPLFHSSSCLLCLRWWRKTPWMRPNSNQAWRKNALLIPVTMFFFFS